MDNDILPTLFHSKSKLSYSAYNNGYEISDISQLFVEHEQKADMSQTQNISSYFGPNELHVNPIFINRLEKFQGFLTANLLIFKEDFQFFMDNGNALIKEYPILTPLANDIYFLGCRLNDFIQQNQNLVLYEQNQTHPISPNGNLDDTNSNTSSNCSDSSLYIKTITGSHKGYINCQIISNGIKQACLGLIDKQ